MNQFNIRELKISDYYLNYYNLLNQLSITSKKKCSFEEYGLIWKNIHENPNHYIFVIEEDNKIVGSITIIIEYKFIHNNSCIGHIEDVVVDKDFRGKGLSKKLIEHCLNLAKIKNCYKVILNCDKDKIELYQKYGFKVVSFGMRNEII